LSAVQHDDYPLLFWFEKAVQDASQVVEIGGHVGIAYYTFERVIEYPKGLLWTIVDVPTVAEAGRKLAAERQRSNLAFVGELAEVKGPIDLLMASGSLQYVPGDLLPKRIGRMANAPRHIILNKTPISDGPGYVTLQNLGPAFCPYRIHGYDELVRPLLDMGYELVDKWQKDRRVEIPGHPERTVLGYSGYYLRKPS
jgi:putative methyltransferase (TIGR04325 family)